MQTDIHAGQMIKSGAQTTELLQDALQMPADSQAYQLAVGLSEQLDTALTELGLDASELYQMSRADQIKLIEQVTDKVLTDQTIGELARLVEQEGLTKASSYGNVGIQEHPSQSTLTKEQQELVNEVVETGKKCTPEDVVRIAKTPAGEIVWYETGNDRAGLMHTINRHGGQFEAREIPKEKIPDYVIEAICQGKIVGYQGKKTPPRVIYEFTYEGNVQRVAIQVGSNGFIVSANPRSMEDIK